MAATAIMSRPIGFIHVTSDIFLDTPVEVTASERNNIGQSELKRNRETTDHVTADSVSESVPVRTKASAFGSTNCRIATPAAINAEATAIVSSTMTTDRRWVERVLQEKSYVTVEAQLVIPHHLTGDKNAKPTKVTGGLALGRRQEKGLCPISSGSCTLRNSSSDRLRIFLQYDTLDSL